MSGTDGGTGPLPPFPFFFPLLLPQLPTRPEPWRIPGAALGPGPVFSVGAVGNCCFRVVRGVGEGWLLFHFAEEEKKKKKKDLLTVRGVQRSPRGLHWARFYLFHELDKACFYHRSAKRQRGTEILGEISLTTLFLSACLGLFSSGCQDFEAPAHLSAGKASSPCLSPSSFLRQCPK